MPSHSLSSIFFLPILALKSIAAICLETTDWMSLLIEAICALVKGTSSTTLNFVVGMFDWVKLFRFSMRYFTGDARMEQQFV
jgi:hypothetical protein